MVTEQTDRWAEAYTGGEGSPGWAERPPSVGDMGDRQANVTSLREKKELRGLQTTVLEYIGMRRERH